ncbi:MFS transporter [Azotosporobacter soli]|uniref:MFS transporter n=1 Tax=Azotosporobacter soli TaxID=3055040 RepID=UPI0031FEBEB8
MSERSVLLIVMSTSFLAPFMASSINLALPTIGREFSADPILLSWIASSYILGAAAFLMPFGRLADIIGRKKIYLSGIIFFSLFTLLSGTADSLSMLLAFRVAQGIASAMLFSTGIAILTSVFPAAKRGYALGLTTGSTYVGLSLGPVLGGFLNYQFGWRSLFFFSAVFAALTAVFAMRRLQGEWREASGEHFDWPGAFSYTAGITLTLYSLSSFSTLAHSAYWLALGLFLLAAFLYYEARQASPLLPVRLFCNNPLFAFSNLAALINYSATFAVSFLLSLHLQLIRHLDSAQSGLILLALPLFMALFSPLAGRLSDRLQPALIASWGMALSALGLFFFTFLLADSPLALILVNLTLVGLGFALFSSPNTNAIMSSVEKKHYGVAASTLAMMRLTGQAVSMAIVTLLFSLHSSSENTSALLLQSSHNAFLIFTALCTCGIFASLARGKRQ